MATVGVLALQGDYSLHAGLLSGLGVAVSTVRRPEELAACDALVLPGGESTTMRRLLRLEGLDGPLVEFARDKPVLGTCAGCILMASELDNAGGVEPLGLLDIAVRRNGFGTQVDSFEHALEPLDPALEDGLPAGKREVAFIRAPRITRVGDGVEVLAVYGQEPVAVRRGTKLALTFHPEVTGVARWHRWWLESAGLA